MIKLNVSKVTTAITIYLGALVILTCFNRVQAQEAQKAGTSSYGTTGNYQSFANGYIYQSKYGTYSVYTTIRMLHERYGGTWGTYGFPITDRYYDQTEKDYCQWFEGGKLCEHANQVELKIRDKENSLGNAKPEGEIHEWCGTYVRDYQSIGGKEDSIIMYNPNKAEAYLITGGIWESYWKKGGCERFGYPEMDERNTGRIEGWYQDFEKATIYWSKSNEKSQPGIVEEEVKEYYHKKGGTWSYLGFPEGEKWGNKDNTKSACGTNGIEQNFNGGKIYISKVGKVDWEYGDKMNKYNEAGGAQGKLGWPANGSFSDNTGIISFENGVLTRFGIRSNGGCAKEAVTYEHIVYEYVSEDGDGLKFPVHFTKVDMQNPHLCAFVDLDKNTVKDDVEQFIDSGRQPLVGINGDYLNENRDGPDGYNRNKYSENSGSHKSTRSSLKIDSFNNATITIGDEYAENVMGGGPKYIVDGNYKWDMQCYKDDIEVSCGAGDFDKTRLNNETFTLNNFLNPNAMSSIGVDKEGDLLIVMNEGYSKRPDKSEIGITPKDMYMFMKSKGAKDAIRFDGGPESYFYNIQSGFINNSILGAHNDHATAFYIFSSENCP